MKRVLLLPVCVSDWALTELLWLVESLWVGRRFRMNLPDLTDEIWEFSNVATRPAHLYLQEVRGSRRHFNPWGLKGPNHKENFTLDPLMSLFVAALLVICPLAVTLVLEEPSPSSSDSFFIFCRAYFSYSLLLRHGDQEEQCVFLFWCHMHFIYFPMKFQWNGTAAWQSLCNIFCLLNKDGQNLKSCSSY